MHLQLQKKMRYVTGVQPVQCHKQAATEAMNATQAHCPCTVPEAPPSILNVCRLLPVGLLTWMHIIAGKLLCSLSEVKDVVEKNFKARTARTTHEEVSDLCVCVCRTVACASVASEERD